MLNIVWIFPHAQRCGINLYATRYCKELDGQINLTTFDPISFCANRQRFLDTCNHADLVHIQYEPSLFIYRGNNYYHRMCSRITAPIVATIHEVYDQFPGVYPRDRITGWGLIGALKRLIYDLKHPAVTAYVQHERNCFYAQTLLVHQEYQKQILLAKKVSPSRIHVMSHPLVPALHRTPKSWDTTVPYQLGTTGFLTTHFDFNLLFSVLKQCPFDWRFTWIGGLRTSQDMDVLNTLKQKINELNWQEKFTITGWVDDATQLALLANLNFYCAFFTARSSSGSLAAAVASHCLICATPLPLTNELASKYGIISVCNPHPDDILKEMQRLDSDAAERDRMISAMADYCNAVSYSVQAKHMVQLYTKVAHPSR